MANNALVNMFRIKELRERIIFTVIILAVFRLGTVLTIPGIDPHALTSYFKGQLQGNAFIDYMDFFAGGAFSNFSVFMLGVTPYISTQILMQLALIIFPSLKKIAEEDGGRKKINTWTRYVTIVVALIQSFTVTVYAGSIPNAIVIAKLPFTLVAMLTVTTGTMITVWLGEQITARGHRAHEDGEDRGNQPRVRHHRLVDVYRDYRACRVRTAESEKNTRPLRKE